MIGFRDLQQAAASFTQDTAPALPLVLLAGDLAQLPILCDDLADLADAGRVRILDPQRDGIAQITEALQAAAPIQSLHIISHGGPGRLYLGNAPLSFDSLAVHGDSLQAWAEQLQGKELLLYGCNVAQGALGYLFLQQLHQLTGAALAASSAPVGRTPQGPQWHLSEQIGAIQTQVLFSEELQQTYAGQFAPPVADDDNYTTSVGLPLIVNAANGVLSGDFDPDGDPLSISLVAIPSNGGGIILNQDGSFEYSPVPGFSGTETFTYQLSDGLELSNVATVSFNVLPALGSSAPVADNDSYSTLVNTPLSVDASRGVLVGDFDIDGGSLSISIVDPPSAGGGILLNQDGSFDYTPPSGFTGVDSFTYQLSDGQFSSNVARVSFNVTTQASTNQAPVVSADSYSTTVDRQIVVNDVNGILSNDSDAEGDALSISIVRPPGNGGTILLNQDGSFTYQPASGFVGTETMTYQVSDGVSDSEATTISFNVLAEATGGDLIFSGDRPSYSGSFETPLAVQPGEGLLTGVSDPNGATLTIEVVQLPGNGTLTFGADGSFVYRPNPGFTGSDSFGYVILSDGVVNSETITAPILIAPPNAAPVITVTNPAYSTPVDTNLVVAVPEGVLRGVSDPEGDTLSILLASNPTNGGILISPVDGSFTYFPNPGFIGTETFSYTVSDGVNTSAPIPVTITVTGTTPPVNQPPVIPGTAPSYTTPVDTNLVVAVPEGVLQGVSDPEGDTLSILLASNPTNGGILISPVDGSFTYFPNPGFIGTETFSYTVSDGVNTSAPIPVTITVTGTTPPVNQPPVIPGTAPSYTTPGDTDLVVGIPEGVLKDVTDPDGDPLTIAIADAPTNGGILLDPNNGSFTYIPNPGFVGTETFTYTVTDGVNTSAPIPVTITVTGTTPPVNQPPVIPDSAPSYIAPADRDLVIAVPKGLLTGVMDPEGDPLGLSLVDNPTNGTILLSPTDGSFTYTPNPGFVGVETFTYSVTDGVNVTAPITVTIEVIGDQDPNKDPNRLCEVFVNFDANTIGELPAGTVITDQFSNIGLTISTPFNPFGAMIFDTANPTGGDTDLSSSSLGKVLIISEDGDSSDPDDDLFGGTIRFEWDSLVSLDSITVMDIEKNGNTISLFDANDLLIQTVVIPTLGDGSVQEVSLGVDNVARMDVNLITSGAVADLNFSGRGFCDVAQSLPGNLTDC